MIEERMHFMHFSRLRTISCGLLLISGCVPEDPEIVESREHQFLGIASDPNEMPSQGACPKCIDVDVLSSGQDAPHLILADTLANLDWRRRLALADEATLTIVTSSGSLREYDIRAVPALSGPVGLVVGIREDPCEWTIHLDLVACTATEEQALPDGSYPERCTPWQTYVRVLGCVDDLTD